MKKLTVLMSAAVCVLLSGCAKETLEVSKTPITITASSDDDVKLSLNEGGIVWNEGDKIAIYDSGEASNVFTLSDGKGGASATFTGSITSGKTAQYAVYPSTTLTATTSYTYITESKSDSKTAVLTGLEIPHIQNAVEGGFDSSAFPAIGNVTEDGGVYSVKFKNIGILFKVVLPAITNLRSVRLCTATGSVLSGAFSVPTASLNDSDTYPYSVISTQFYPDVILKKSDNTDIAAGTYYIAALPSVNGASMKTFSSRNSLTNMQIQLTCADGSFAHKTLTGITTTERSNVYTIDLSKVSSFSWKNIQEVTFDFTTKPTEFTDYTAKTKRSKTDVSVEVESGHVFKFLSKTGQSVTGKDKAKYTDGWFGWWWSSSKYLQNYDYCNGDATAISGAKAQFQMPDDFDDYKLYEIQFHSTSQDKLSSVYNSDKFDTSISLSSCCMRQATPDPSNANNPGHYSLFINRNSDNLTGSYFVNVGHSGSYNLYNSITCVYEKDVTSE